jgi:hypothetical protein
MRVELYRRMGRKSLRESLRTVRWEEVWSSLGIRENPCTPRVLHDDLIPRDIGHEFIIIVFIVLESCSYFAG